MVFWFKEKCPTKGLDLHTLCFFPWPIFFPEKNMVWDVCHNRVPQFHPKNFRRLTFLFLEKSQNRGCRKKGVQTCPQIIQSWFDQRCGFFKAFGSWTHAILKMKRCGKCGFKEPENVMQPWKLWTKQAKILILYDSIIEYGLTVETRKHGDMMGISQTWRASNHGFCN